MLNIDLLDSSIIDQGFMVMKQDIQELERIL